MNHKNTQELLLEEVIGDRFGRYSKYIIQDRALPDARDGLKPVQRRILYAMYEDGNVYEKPFRKSAKTVGNVIGNYHPHGDSSVYEAMVRMSQDWKLRDNLVEMHGNNGSVDGDPPAAMRYTEARISKLAGQLLIDIEKKTVDHIPNFDDSILEPTVLPANFPNLLVNGSTGISAGYATEIPSHNLKEVIDAVILRMDNPDCSVEKLMSVIPGPDFATGGIIQGINGIKQAYETGKGKIILRGKTEVLTTKNGRSQIVITEIPFECNKANLVKKIDDIRVEKKIDGIQEVRDESDRLGMRIVIEIKKNVSSETLLHYLYKHTELQITYNFNMVAINGRKPMLMSLPELLDAYIEHRKEVVLRRSNYDLNKAREREHIVFGFIKALSILDEIIKTIRASTDKKDARQNLIKQFAFTEVQAEAIVMMQLYRLTNTDILALEREAEELQNTIKKLEVIILDGNQLNSVIKLELKVIRKNFQTQRRSLIEENIEELKIAQEKLISNEETIVSVTAGGYIKRSSVRSFMASNIMDIGIKEGDTVLKILELKTVHTLLLFTNKGNYLVCPVHHIPDVRWKDVGQYIGNLISIDADEKVISAIPVVDYNQPLYVTYVTKMGVVKRTELNQLKAQRISRPLVGIKLKKYDKVHSVFITNGYQYLFIGSETGRGLIFFEEEIPVVSTKASGVIGMKIEENKNVIESRPFSNLDSTMIIIISKQGEIIKFKLSNLTITSRNKVGNLLFNNFKRIINDIASIHILDNLSCSQEINIKLLSGTTMIVKLANITDFKHTNSTIFKLPIENDIVETTWLEAIVEKVNE